MFYKIFFMILMSTVSSISWCINTESFFSNSYAVVIGVREYEDDWDVLRYAENDAVEIGRYFSDQGYIVKKFLSEQATRRNIVSYLEDELPEIIKEDDRVVIYFSGHGDKHEKSNDGYVIPYDGIKGKPSTWISMKKLQQLSSINGIAKHQLFILDACFAGSFATKSSKNEEKLLQSHIARSARQFLAAGLAGEKTPAESDLKGYEKHSYYTSYLLKGLREGTADNYYDGFITLTELGGYLQGAARTERNTPVSGHFNGHESGSFVFSSPIKAEHISLKPVPRAVQDKGNVELEKNLHEANKKILILEEANRALKAQRKDEGKLVLPRNTIPPSRKRSSLTKSQEKEAELEWFQDIQYSTDPKTVQEYLNNYPNGPMTAKAQRKLKNLR